MCFRDIEKCFKKTVFENSGHFERGSNFEIGEYQLTYLTPEKKLRLVPGYILFSSTTLSNFAGLIPM